MDRLQCTKTVMMKKIHIMIDCGMLILLPLLMAYSLIGEAVHEYLGIATFLLFVVHHIMNAAWWRNLFRGKYSPARVVMTVTDILLVIIMAALPVSGIVMSRYAFSFLQITGGVGMARTVHLLTSYWGFVLMSFHAGLHGQMVVQAIRKTLLPKSSKCAGAVLSLMAAMTAACGVYAFIRRQFADYMFLKVPFVFFNFDEPRIYFMVDYITIMLLFAFLGYYLLKLLKKKKKILIEKNLHCDGK